MVGVKTKYTAFAVNAKVIGIIYYIIISYLLFYLPSWGNIMSFSNTCLKVSNTLKKIKDCIISETQYYKEFYKVNAREY